MRSNLANLRQQQGISLLESLIAIVVMALGILGVMGVQMRTLNDTQTTVRRAQAIRLIEDLSERMKANPNALVNIDTYLTSWDNKPTASKNCRTSVCSHTEWASFDRAEWKKSVNTMLPLVDASVFIPSTESASSNAGNQRLIGVMISWRENEKNVAASDKNAYNTPINASVGAGSSGDLTCKANSSCHLQFLPVSARCAPYFAASATVPQFFCPGA